jgi:hypothetical protein
MWENFDDDKPRGVRFEDLPRPRKFQPHITVLCLGSEWAAVHMVLVPGGYWDIEQTSDRRYATRRAAARAARAWALADGMRTRNLIAPAKHSDRVHRRAGRFAQDTYFKLRWIPVPA